MSKTCLSNVPIDSESVYHVLCVFAVLLLELLHLATTMLSRTNETFVQSASGHGFLHILFLVQ